MAILKKFKSEHQLSDYEMTIGKPKRVKLIDLLNDLEKEGEINKRIKEHLIKEFDSPLHMMSGTFPSSIGNINSTIFRRPY